MIHDEGIPFAHLEELTLFYLYLRVSGSVVSDDRCRYMLQFDDNRSGIEHTTDLQGRHLPDHGIRDTLKKAENATVGRVKLLIFRDLESAARYFSVLP